MAFVLGSGLGQFAEGMAEQISIPYSEIPHFPLSTVVGHSGRLTLAGNRNRPFCALQGRVHFYEGLSMADIVFPVRSLALWGVQAFVITNAAGAVNLDFRPGHLMMITDHLNLLGENPLAGPNLDDLGVRFPDMSCAYSDRLRSKMRQCAQDLALTLKEGVYAAVKGPSYETPAEIRMLQVIGADAVGMSTVPEVIALNHLRREVVGISCITNMAAGLVDAPMDHEDVLRVTTQIRDDFGKLLLHFQEDFDG